MASSSFNTLHRDFPFSSNSPCKFPSTFSHFPIFFPLIRLKNNGLLLGQFSSIIKYNKTPKRLSFYMTQKVTKSGSHYLRSKNERLVKKSVEDIVNLVVEEKNDKRFEKGRSTRGRGRFGFNKNGSFKASGDLSNGDKIKEKSKKNQVVEEREKLSKEDNKIPLRVNLDMCSKNGDVMGAIKLYEWAQEEGIELGQYHYTVILYLCSSAALGVVQPAKSGSGNRILSSLSLSKVGSSENSINLDEEFSDEGCESLDRTELNTKNVISKLDGIVNGKENVSQFANGSVQILNEKKDGRTVSGDGTHHTEKQNILVDGELKKYALKKGFEIYEKMCVEEIPMNEATLTSVARMAISMGDGDMAFNMVKQMKPLGINPRLRSYGPALSAFCSNEDIDKAFAVEKHMLEHGVYPEEPELESLLRVSIKASNADKVYYLLHKLRTTVRQVSPSTADLIVTWFESKDATRVGKMKVDQERIKKAMESGGGGWHGLGWLGRGMWIVSSTNVEKDGLCKSCGEKLATIDLDPIETENFAESVATIARQREKNSSFQKFQKWLDYYGPYEAVIDAANVGLFSQRKFTPSKVNLIANGIRQKLPSKKWPLIVLHNRRITGHKMDEPVNKTMIEKWKNADALYATPTGSNDDWFWLYAAIKFKCLIVTNDEMRDHTFQLLGNDFFPRWKERHQVHFSFSDSGPVFHMPPPCSVVIQESAEGHWHVPIISEHSFEADRKWLCITRGKSQSHVVRQESSVKVEESRPLLNKGNSKTQAKVEIKQRPSNQVDARNSSRESYKSLKQPSNQVDARISSRESYKSLKQIFWAAVLPTECSSLVSEIEAAEKLAGCTIDFQI